ncbi:MAG: hypothetical protein ABR573_10530, partial [Candidatus Dormibacteria bacterium]
TPDEIAEALRGQLTGAVRWIECVNSLLSLGATRFLELGPGGTLCALGRRIAPSAAWETAPGATGAVAVTG